MRRLRRHLGAMTVGLTVFGTAATVLPVMSATTAHAAQPTRSSATARAEDPAGPAAMAGNDELARLVAASGASLTVPLVTGDTVDVGLDGDGRPVVRGTEAAPRPDGSAVVFHTVTHLGTVHVVPNDALALLGNGLLDWSLFDLTELATLVSAGRTDEVPVIVTYADKGAVAKAPRTAGASGGRALPSVGARSMDIAGDGTWWQGVRGKSAAAGTARSAGSLAGVKKVWLNGLNRISLDVSVPQIGADVAWERGYDGTGVSVAVLDTGIDAAHPDVADDIVEKRDFTGTSAEAEDGHGHGTHVASTILGSGAASEGRYKGVAPGAGLRVGKVCDDEGRCPTDAIIAGMEWAAHSGADVVNMSLGGDPTDGTDPASEALDRLSRETGTLFVVAAGNSGPAGQTVGSPGAADEALTVAAVDKSDRTAYFSSRGPRVGDYAPKPDIAAPGVGIVAARAAGTAMGTVVDDRYTSADGTSMATPHVAGAAAVVAQQHPELTGRQLKALLMGSAEDIGHDETEQGAGRVDLADATEPRIIATGDLNFSRTAYPHAAVEKKVTYTNLTDEATTLHLTGALTSGGTRAPDGLLTLNADEVALPAGGSAEVTVTLDGGVLGTDGAFGRWDGSLTARDTSGAIRTTSRVHALLEAERFPLTVNVVPPEGATSVTYGNAVFMPVDDKELLHDGLVTQKAAKSTTVSLYKGGTYSATVPVTWRDAAGQPQSAAPVVAETTLTGATTVILDLRDLVPVGVRTPVATETYTALSSTHRVSATGTWELETALTTGYQAQEPNWWALPTEKVRTGTLTQNTAGVRTTPVVTMKAVGGGDAFDLSARYQTPDVSLLTQQLWVGETTGFRNAAAPVPRLKTGGRLPVVHAGTGTAAELAAADVDGRLVLLTPTDLCGSTGTCDFDRLRDERVAAAAEAGAVGVLVAAPGLTSLGADYGLQECPVGPENCSALQPYAALPVVSVDHDRARRLVERLRADPADVRIVLGGRAEPAVYAASFVAEGRIPSSLEYRLRTEDLRRVDHSFHAERPGTVDGLTWEQYTRSASASTAMDLPLVATQRKLTVFVRQQDDAIDRFTASWGDNTDHSALAHTRGETRDLVLTRENELHWNDGPSVPGAVPQVRTASGFTVASGPCAACRQGDTFYPTFYLTGSGGGRQALIGVLDNEFLTDYVFGITGCAPTAPSTMPMQDAGCDFTLKDSSGREVERRLRHISSQATGGME